MPGINDCSTNNGGCSDLCLATPSHVICSCRDGFSLSIDRHTCQGIYVIDVSQFNALLYIFNTH